jgi:hypothetical protein
MVYIHGNKQKSNKKGRASARVANPAKLEGKFLNRLILSDKELGNKRYFGNQPNEYWTFDPCTYLPTYVTSLFDESVSTIGKI